MRLDAAQPSSVLAVPETAITYTAYGQTVFVATRDPEQGTRVSRVRVTTGERWQGRVEITSGLAPGDQVVVSGQLKLSDGMPVEPVAQDSLQASHGGRQS
ncbi:Efflux pump periplasmic linker BepD precursor [compost metagenome]